MVGDDFAIQSLPWIFLKARPPYTFKTKYFLTLNGSAFQHSCQKKQLVDEIDTRSSEQAMLMSGEQDLPDSSSKNNDNNSL